ncbi:MAG: PKD domain-containing protein [Cyclobacteriaceae bacterium]|nr:PKD domain-containing protein [Cyclobacteriaceae bacterium]
MRKILLILLVGVSIVTWESCSDDGFPVPPASTVPKFSVSLTNDGFAPATATFTDQSIVPERAGEVAYAWVFGDGGTSAETNPVHEYVAPGVYNVKLTITSFKLAEATEYVQKVVVLDQNATGIPVFFTDGNAVFKALINEDDPISVSIGITALEDSYGIAIDTVNAKLYISDYDADKILVANLDGSDLHDFRTNTGGADGMAIDYEAQVIYWDTDDGIRKADLNNTSLNQMEDFVTGQVDEDPEGVSIDPVTGFVYWNTYNAGVWRKNKNGSGLQEVIPDLDGAGPGGGGGSTVIIGSRIFYDVYVASGDIHIKSANLDGSSIATVTTGVSRVIFGLAYDRINEKIYWADRNNEVVKRANLDGTGTQTWLTGKVVQGLAIGRE